jgi:two-component system sensor histidine kinase BaeS
MLSKLRQRLGIKLFISYLVIILIGVIVLAASAELVIPTAFQNHMSHMMEGSMMGMMGNNMGINLFDSFRNAFNEALTRAAIAAFLSAVIVSIFVTRKVIAPIREMMAASQKIADGQYEQRVKVNSRPDDADELSQLAISFNQMAEKLAQTENMRRQLIGDVAHELRTPLTAIQGSMEGLLDGVLSPSDETYQTVYREADRLKHLVDDLQELSRVEAGAYELNRKSVSPSSLVNSTIKRLSRQFEEKGVSLNTDLSPDSPNVLVDEDRIEQVLLNLVGNALQYTPPGGKVWVSTRHKDPDIIFEVSDTGIGIPVENLSLVFTRFYRVDKSRSRAGGGSGIGLTIARYLVEAHGGRIWVESPGKDQGSVFSFSLPAEK